MADEMETQNAHTTLVPLEKYLKTGAHIGTRFKTGDMRRYIFKLRKDGLKVMDVDTIDARIRMAAAFLAHYPPARIVVASRKLYGVKPASRFCEIVGARAITGRFVPGTFTNPAAKEFIEPAVVLVTDPDADAQAIAEATRVHVPVVALATTSNTIKNVDLVLPINNKGRKSLALVYWLLAREYLKNREIIKSDEDFTTPVEEFEHVSKEGEGRDDSDDRRGRGRGGGRFGRDSDRRGRPGGGGGRFGRDRFGRDDD